MRSPTILLLALPFLPLTVPRAAPVSALPQDSARAQEEKQEEAEPPRFPKGERAPGRDIFGRRSESAESLTLAGRVQGCWQLIDLDSPTLPRMGRAGEGILLIGKGFMSLELHLTWPESAKNLVDVHQSFTGEYALTADGVMSVSSVIGSFIDDTNGQLEWERSGYPREYIVRESDGLLRLQFNGGNIMSFARLRSSNRQPRDIFGRATSEAVGSRDVFGRPISAERGTDEERRNADDPRRRSDPPIEDDKKDDQQGPESGSR